MDPEARGCVCVFHYLDYFLLVGLPSSNQCEEHLKILLKTFDRLNIPVALEKLEGPTTVLTFLGIEMDTQNSTLCLPRDKVQELKSLIATWTQRKSCTKRDLHSLVGKLQHACKVVCSGRSFLRKMFELLRGTAKKQHFIRLNRSFHSDLRWWHLFLESWNGVAMMGSREWQPKIHLFVDVLGSFGCGAWWDQSWLQVAWTSDVQEWSIAQKELLPIVLAPMLWGKVWRGKAVLVHCDNWAVVEVVNSGYCRDQGMMQMIRCLFFHISIFQGISADSAHSWTPQRRGRCYFPG